MKKETKENKKVIKKVEEKLNKEIKELKSDYNKNVKPKNKIKKDKEKIKEKKIKEKKQKREFFSLTELVILIVLTALVASVSTGSIMYFKYRNSNAMNYYKLEDDEQLQEFIEIYSKVLKEYYGDVDKDEMINTTINAMLNYLGDSYTSYLTEEQAEELNKKLSGTYQGIGIQISYNTIIDVFDDTPASEAGLKENDIIKSIDGTEMTQENYQDLINEIKTGDKESFNFVIERDGETLELEITRSTVVEPNISYGITEKDDKHIGYIYIETFSKTVASQISKALTEMEDEGIDSLIIDVRGNTGGYLVAASDISKLFLEKGKVIYSLENNNGTTSYKDDTSDSRDYNIAVLINGASASSSEILAAALKDSYGAILVGTKSYGKGKVQNTMNLTSGGMAKYTSSKWLRPNGECIDGEGLTPDYEVQLDISGDGDVIEDNQLNKALEILSK